MNWSEWLEFEFVRRALLAMVLLGVLYPPLGVFVVNQRLAYFGDSVAHSAFLGAALAGWLGWQTENLLLILAPLFALLLWGFQRRTGLPPDTLLVVFVTTTAALGIALMSFASQAPPLRALLFGDLLALEKEDLWRLLAISVLGLGFLMNCRHAMIRLTFHRELAQAQGVPVHSIELLFLVLLSVAVAVGLKAVGILPISALLVLPAATARMMSRSFHRMLIWSWLLGGIALFLGFGVALSTPIPPGASVALGAGMLFLGGLGFRWRSGWVG